MKPHARFEVLQRLPTFTPLKFKIHEIQPIHPTPPNHPNPLRPKEKNTEGANASQNRSLEKMGR